MQNASAIFFNILQAALKDKQDKQDKFAAKLVSKKSSLDCSGIFYHILAHKVNTGRKKCPGQILCHCADLCIVAMHVLISCQEQRPPADEAARFEDRIVVHDGFDIVVPV